MRFSAVWLALVFSVGPGLVANAAAQAVGDAPVSECEQARLDWAANYPPTPPESNSDRLAYLDRYIDTKELRFDLNCDHRLSFEEFLTMDWTSWLWMDTDADGAVTKVEYVTDWCTRRLGWMIEEDPGARPVCERASGSNYRDVAGFGRTRLDRRSYRFASYVLFRRADRNRDGYLTRTPHSAHYYE